VWRILARTFLACVAGLCFSSLCPAAALPAIQLAWDRNPEPDIAGYELRYGTSPGIYPNVINAGTNTAVAVSGLKEGETYHFVVVARNSDGLTSLPSAKVTYRVEPPVIEPPVIEPPVIEPPVIEPPVAEITSPPGDLIIPTGDTVNFTGAGSDPGGNLPLAYSWSFSFGGDSQAQNPGARTFSKAGVYTVSLTVRNSDGLVDPTPSTRTIIVKDPSYAAIPRAGWKVTYVDSQETSGYAAVNALDDDPSTFWHTKFKKGKLKKPPHEIRLDMRSSRKVSGFQYLPRQDGVKIVKLKFYVSADGRKWGKPVASGTFQNSSGEKQIRFPTKTGRYIRLLILSEVNGYSDSNIAELKVLELVKAARNSATPSALAAASAATGTSAPSTATSPLAAAATPAISPTKVSTVVIRGKKYLTLTITKPAIPDGVKRTVEVSPDLVRWFSGKNFTTVITDNDRFLKIRDNTPVTTSRKRYIRLKPVSR
jgi:PKD repeat protein